MINDKGLEEGRRRYGSLRNQDGISKAERDLAIGKPIPSKGGDDGMENGDEEAAVMKWLDSHRHALSDLPMADVIKKAVAAGFDSDTVNRVADKLFNARKNDRSVRCTCGGTVEPVAGEDDRFECDECGQLYERDDWRSDRYKAINAGDISEGDYECAECGGRRFKIMSATSWPDSDLKCTKCGWTFHHSRENASSECATCGHRPSSHTDGKGNAAGCSICDCDKYQKTVENAGNCECGHEYNEHDKKDSQGDPLACSKCGCDGYHKLTRENDMTLGYDYGTTTTMVPAGSECKECGHTIGQVFAGCPCRCHTELGNTVCDICRREEGAGLEEHLVTKHGIDPDVAVVVAADMESVR